MLLIQFCHIVCVCAVPIISPSLPEIGLIQTLVRLTGIDYFQRKAKQHASPSSRYNCELQTDAYISERNFLEQVAYTQKLEFNFQVV